MKFISDGTWFDKGTEVKIDSEHCTVYSSDGIPTLQVLAVGLRNGSIDEELCTMDEFWVVGDDYGKPVTTWDVGGGDEHRAGPRIRLSDGMIDEPRRLN